MKTENWTIYRDSFDENGTFLAVTREEHAALVRWFGASREVLLDDLGQPTFEEFGESKAGAFQAALSALERFDAELVERVRVEQVETESSYTPGPWWTEEEYINCSPLLVYAADSVIVADLSRATNAERADNPQANARLISAAPDMLAALHKAEGLLCSIGNEAAASRYGSIKHNYELIPSVLNELITVIAKAEGRAE